MTAPGPAAPMDASAGDRRHDQAELVWSAGPNQWVDQVCADLPPGRAPDLAAGEGRNAVWWVHRALLPSSGTCVARRRKPSSTTVLPACRRRQEGDRTRPAVPGLEGSVPGDEVGPQLEG